MIPNLSIQIEAIDNKNNVISQLAAIELLIEHKVTPPRTVFLALGHDEEIGGENGAAYIAKYFTGQPNFKPFEFILDEGSMIVKGGIPGFTSHIALISTSEKGYVTLNIKRHLCWIYHEIFSATLSFLFSFFLNINNNLIALYLAMV